MLNNDRGIQNTKRTNPKTIVTGIPTQNATGADVANVTRVIFIVISNSGNSPPPISICLQELSVTTIILGSDNRNIITASFTLSSAIICDQLNGMLYNIFSTNSSNQFIVKFTIAILTNVTGKIISGLTKFHFFGEILIGNRNNNFNFYY